MKAEYQNHSLDDFAVANAARRSFDKLAEAFSPEQNHSLIQFLARGMSGKDWDGLVEDLVHISDADEIHDLLVYVRKIPEHWAPFAHPHITLTVDAPVPIRTQCFKHKQGFVESEVSRRYISAKPTLYVPGTFRAVAADKKQGSGDTHERSQQWKATYIDYCTRQIGIYEKAIEDGVCPEQARFFLPQGVEVKWTWTGSLYAYASFYNQRTDSHAQKEIQDLAHQIGDIIHPLYPVSWEALTQGVY